MDRVNMLFADGGAQYWILCKLFITAAQIIAAIVILPMSRHEHPHAPLRTWVIGYVCGCVVSIPILFWRFYHRNESSPEVTTVNTLLALGSAFCLNPRTSALNTRLKVAVELFSMGLYSFLIIWFFIGLWVLFKPSMASGAPNLYRLCLAFCSIDFIVNLIPAIVFTIFCCQFCIFVVWAAPQNRGATTESINSLPTYKFKMNSIEGGIVAAGTEKERVLSGEDAECSICLANYADNDDLRKLLCTHYFHKHCVDKWLRMNAFCPLCKSKIGQGALV